MSPAARSAPNRRSRRRRGRVAARWLLRIAVVALTFALGVALGEALQDNPDPAGERTFVRTLKPLPVSPAARTVTVTVTVTTG